MSKVVEFIEMLRGPKVDHIPGLDHNDTSYYIMGEIFTRGNCGAFALALQMVFSGDVVFIPSEGHYVLLLDGKLYDIDGDVTTKYLHYRNPPSPSHLEDCTHNYSFIERGPIM